MKTLRVEKSPLRPAIRGGGHSTLVWSPNIEGAITLDMRGMNNISLLQENGQIVFVGASAMWSDFYSKLDPLNLSVVGGHGYDVGVAGFTLEVN
jgi:FAD/FMN-containing dehydrogenase